MHARRTAPGGSPTPPWLWLLLLGGFGLIFYQFVPKAEISVRYYPWFYEQVQADNIKSISIQGTEIRGELRKETAVSEPPNQQPVQRSNDSSPTPPSEASIDAIVQKLIQLNEKKTADEKKAGELVQDRSPAAHVGERAACG